MQKLKENRALSFIIVTLVYIAAFGAGYAVFQAVPQSPYLIRIGLGDLAATLVVYIFSLIFNNASVYDPYWSVAPMVILAFVWADLGLAGGPAYLILIAVMVWGARLTVNWAVNFENLNAQDWRYTKFQQASPKLWFLVNFFGIQLMPTLVVFLGMAPAIDALQGEHTIGASAVVGMILCGLAVLLQVISDSQMLKFRKDAGNQGKINDRGLWKYSRHPNYLGEILFWWGVWTISLSAGISWYFVMGPVIVTLLFLFISIPLMEKRQLARRPAYADYQQKTGMLLPNPLKRRK